MKTPFHDLVALIILDVIVLFGVFSVAHLARIGEWIDPLSSSLWMIILSAVLCLYVMDAYVIRETRRTWKFLQDSFAAIIGIGLTNIVLTYLVGVEHFTSIYGRGVLSVAVIMFFFLAISYRRVVSEKILTFQSMNFLEPLWLRYPKRIVGIIGKTYVEYILEDKKFSFSVKGRILTDPITGYMIDAFTLYKSHNRKFIPDRSYYNNSFIQIY